MAPHPHDPHEPEGARGGLDDEPEPPDHGGRLRTTSPASLIGLLLAGVVVGRLVRPVAESLDAAAPRVTWVQGAVLYLAGLILLAVARVTYAAVHQRRERLLPHQAVNRLVLAKACALTGAAVAGGYLGYALSWVGAEAELARERIAMSLIAAGGAALTAAGALLLERACRIRDDDEPH